MFQSILARRVVEPSRLVGRPPKAPISGADGSALRLPEPFGGWKPDWAQPYFWAPFIYMGDPR